MIKWLIILGFFYLAVLFAMALISKRKNRSSEDFIFAGSNIGLLLGFMSFAATLFSTFTLMGMPDCSSFHSHSFVYITFGSLSRSQNS